MERSSKYPDIGAVAEKEYIDDKDIHIRSYQLATSFVDIIVQFEHDKCCAQIDLYTRTGKILRGLSY